MHIPRPCPRHIAQVQPPPLEQGDSGSSCQSIFLDLSGLWNWYLVWVLWLVQGCFVLFRVVLKCSEVAPGNDMRTMQSLIFCVTSPQGASLCPLREVGTQCSPQRTGHMLGLLMGLPLLPNISTPSLSP